jgi:hypothetical protein
MMGLRRRRGAGSEDELGARERQALQINDNIVQGLARVKWALEAGDVEAAKAAADETLGEAQRMVTDLLMSRSGDGSLNAGHLRRDVPAGASVD